MSGEPIPSMCYVVRSRDGDGCPWYYAPGFTLPGAIKKAQDFRPGATQRQYAICEDTAFFVPYPVERLQESDWLPLDES